MSRIFYDHLVTSEEIILHLDTFVIDPEEKEELTKLIDEIFHHHILNVILNHLPKPLHLEFIDRFTTNPADPGLIDYIQTKVEVDIEEELKKHSQRVKSDLLNEIKKHKKR